MIHTIKLHENLPEQLRSYGFHLLTGEACGVGHRTLFDVDEKAMRIWEGMTRTSITNSAWNGKPAVGSLMIPFAWLPDLALWCLLIGDTCHTVMELVAAKNDYIRHAVLLGASDEDSLTPLPEPQAKLLARGTLILKRNYFRSQDPGTGLDNRHAFSGRTT